MLNLDGLQGPESGIAFALDEPSPSLAQSSAITSSAKTRSEQQAAIIILLDQHDDIILAYLRFARSLNRNLYYFSGYGSLSKDQVLAVCALRDCDDIEIKAWLKQARKFASDSGQSKHPQGGTLQEPGFADPSSLGQSRGTLHSPRRRASICAPSDVFGAESSQQGIQNASRVHSQQSLNKINTSHEATKAANLYWCTICEDRHSYKNLSDWRKHEKEHVDTYVCMLGGPLELTEGRFKCILCGTFNPSEEHLDAHKVQICGQGVPGSFSCKRRADLVRHLRKCHNVHAKAQGEAIADKWKETTNKQAWSCGFCIHLAYTFGDRLKHIAMHFEHGQTLDEWDATNVMKGLLSQPQMINAWKTQLAFSLGCASPDILWKKHAVRGLQHDLEVGPSDTEDAAALAKAAYEARQSSWNSLNGDEPLALAPLYGASGPSTLCVSTNDYGLISERALHSSLTHDQSQFVANPAETLRYGVSALGGIPMATDDHNPFPASSSDDGNSSIKDPWLLDPDQVWSSAANQYSGSIGYQEDSNATTSEHIWPTPAAFNDKPEAGGTLA